MYRSQRFIITKVLIITLALSGTSSAAQELLTDYPTLTALESTTIPPADPIALAARLREVRDIPAPPESTPTRQVGEQQTFWVTNSSEDQDFQVSATLRVVGEHIYLWLEDGAPVSDADLQSLADAFDHTIYEGVVEIWGSEAKPGVDGDPRLYGLFAHGLGAGIAAYFQSRHIYPTAIYPTSNQHEMFFFNLDAINPAAVDSPWVESTIAHEFQHMIRANIQDNEALWLNEGFSMFTQLYLYHDAGAIPSFFNAPETQLNTWTEDGTSAPHYGAATLFVNYFYERYGLEALQQLSADPGIGLIAFDDVLKSLGEAGVNDLFADWVLANYLLNPALDDGRFGYKLLSGLPSPAPLATVANYPYIVNRQANQYAADYYVLNATNTKALNISLATPQTVQLIPTDAASGEWMWYSNRGDQSDMTLTREFDLSGVETATLHYKTWYDIEDTWDYAYLMVSADEGATWDILPTERTTADNPHDAAYGPGYTGESGGWVEETVSLDTYVGKSIWIRFELITDDGVSQPGLAIDDVDIPEIGYSSDFEGDGGGWEANGWMRIDNRLPQQVWVQAVQQVGNEVAINRWVTPLQSHQVVPIVEGAEQVILVVAPFAPSTTVPISYTLSVSAG
jgi:immune inhibitor A